jgi:hypothetical protein
MQPSLHDIVNCLTAARGYSEVLAEQLLPTEPDKARLVKSLGEEVWSVWRKHAALLLPGADQ